MKIFPQVPHLCLVEYRWYKLCEDFCYQWTKDGIEYEIVVKEGFCTDLASIPRVVHSLIGPQDLSITAPLVHDLLYACKGQITDYRWGNHYTIDDSGERWLVGQDWSRYNTDRLMGRMMREGGVSKLKRRLGYLAVRAGGFWAWLKTREGDKHYS